MHYSHFTGNYSVEVRNSSNEIADRQICDLIHLPFAFVAHTVNISCKPAVPMDVIIINRTNYGSLNLCDFKLRGILEIIKHNSLLLVNTFCKLGHSCISTTNNTNMHHYFFSLYIRYTTFMAYCMDIRVICLHHDPTRDRTKGLLTVSQKRYRLTVAGPWALFCLKTYINLMMCLTM